MSDPTPLTYNLNLGAPYGIQAIWIRAQGIHVAGFSGEVLCVSTCLAGVPSLSVTQATPLMFYALKGGQLVDVSTQLNPNTVSSVDTRTILMTDFNGDGLSDIFLGNQGTEAFTPFPGEQNQLLLQTGLGQFLNKTSNLPQLADFTHMPDFGDLNGDGYLDIFVNNLGGGSNPGSYILVNDGKGNFSYLADTNLHKNGVFGGSVSQYLGSPLSLVIDINQDGKNDIFYGPISTWDGAKAVDVGYGYLENNNGVFNIKFNSDLFWPGPSSGIFSAKKADFNHDGHDDIILAGTAADSSLLVQVYYSSPGGVKNVSSSVLNLSSLASQPVAGGIDLEAADINGDGAPDFEVRTYTAGFTSELRYTFINDGRGNFGAPIKNMYGISSAKGSYVDLNGDGLVDFVHPVSNGLQVLYGANANHNNVFYGTTANDFWMGQSASVNTANYFGNSREYKISLSSTINNAGVNYSGIKVADQVSNRDGIDSLVNVMRLKFTDTNIALDIGANQIAGSSYMLYKAAFNRTPDVGGLGFWISKMDGGMSYDTVAQNFVNSQEFKTAFGGSNPSVNTLVTKLYNNVLIRTPDTGGLAFWQDKLTTGGWTTANVLGYFATSNENVANVASLIANGINYAEYLG